MLQCCLWEISISIFLSYFELRIWCGTFDRAWIGHLYGAERLSTRGKAHSAQWRTWWSHSIAHSLWAWSLTRRGSNIKKNQIINTNILSKYVYFEEFPWRLPLHRKMTTKAVLVWSPAVSVDEEPLPTWPPDAFGRRWDTTVKALVPFSKKPVDHFPLLIHHKSLNLVHVRTPVVSLKDKYHVVSFPLPHLRCDYSEEANITLKYITALTSHVNTVVTDYWRSFTLTKVSLQRQALLFVFLMVISP